MPAKRNPALKKKPAPPAASSSKQENSDENPLVNAVISQLGGREIKR